MAKSINTIEAIRNAHMEYQAIEDKMSTLNNAWLVLNEMKSEGCHEVNVAWSKLYDDKKALGGKIKRMVRSYFKKNHSDYSLDNILGEYNEECSYIFALEKVSNERIYC